MILKILLFILLIASPLYAQEWQEARLNVAIVGGGVTAAACGPGVKESEEVQDTQKLIGRADSEIYVGTMITTASNYKLCKIGIPFMKTLVPTFNFTVKLYDNNPTPSDRPGNLLEATTTTPIDADVDLTTSYLWYYFDFANYQLANATKYWIVIVCDGYTDASNYVRWGADATDSRSATGTDGITWSIQTTMTPNYRTYAYE